MSKDKVLAKGEELSRKDGWENAVTSLGTARDKTKHNRFVRNARIDDNTLESIYNGDPYMAKICDKPAELMFRRGVDFQIEGEVSGEKVTKLQAKWEELNADEHLTDGKVFESVFGGSAVFMGINDGRDQSEPVDETKIESVEFLSVIDKRNLMPKYYDNNPSSKTYGEPSIFNLQFVKSGGVDPRALAGEDKFFGDKQTVPVHRSRLLLFKGRRATQLLRLERNGWGISEIERVINTLQMFNTNVDSVKHMLADASQGVYKIKGLIDMITSGAKEELVLRMEVTDMMRSVVNAIVLDADVESFERKDTTMSGMPEVIDRTMILLAAAADIPVAILMGREPSGLNATGASDLRNWYDKVSADRKKHVQPQVKQLARMILLSKDGPTNATLPESWGVTFPPAYEPNDMENADLRLKHAQADSMYIDKGVLTPEEATLGRFRPEGYSNDLGSLDLDSRKAALDMYLKKMADGDSDLMDEPAPDAGLDTQPTEGAPATGAADATKVADQVLNGAQITSLVDIISKVALNQIPRDAAVNIISIAFQVDAPKAERLLGTSGRGFVPTLAGEPVPVTAPATPQKMPPAGPVLETK